MDTIFPAFCFVLAINNGYKLFVGDVLESFRAANIARVGIDEEERFDL
jgi:hypothetical protein